MAIHFTGGDRDPQTTPTIDGKYLYTLSVDGKVFCFKAKNGKVRWETNMVEEHGVQTPFYGFAGSPIVDGEILLMTANSSGIALNKKTGKKLWISSFPEEMDLKDEWTGVDYTTPVLYEREGGRYAAFFSERGLQSVEVETGNHHWLYELEVDGSAIAADPLIFDNAIFLTRGYLVSESILLNVSGDKPKVVWSAQDVGSAISSPIMLDGHIYLSDGDYDNYNYLRCMDSRTGQTMWEEKMRMASLTASDGKLLVLGEKGTLSVIKASLTSYEEISSCTIPDQKRADHWWTPPVLFGGRIYCRSYLGDLVCIDVSE